jgi:broad specificity phosphatase PhoE
MITVPAKHFYMIRHGETVANAEGWVAGSLDTPLTDKGRRQPQAARQVLETLPLKPKLIIHTGLSRTKDTAIILNENLNLPMLERATMAEWCLGDWASIPLKTWVERREAGLTPPNGESKEAFGQRVIGGLEEVLNLPEEPLLIVTHGGVFRALMRHYKLNIGNIENCHLYEFVPSTENAPFPWKVWSHHVSEEGIVSRKLVEAVKMSEAPVGRTSVLSRTLQHMCL